MNKKIENKYEYMQVQVFPLSLGWIRGSLRRAKWS